MKKRREAKRLRLTALNLKREGLEPSPTTIMGNLPTNP